MARTRVVAVEVEGAESVLFQMYFRSRADGTGLRELIAEVI